MRHRQRPRAAAWIQNVRDTHARAAASNGRQDAVGKVGAGMQLVEPEARDATCLIQCSHSQGLRNASSVFAPASSGLCRCASCSDQRHNRPVPLDSLVQRKARRPSEAS
eukprot:scaffold86948_cov33-Tisochrysis_lutea.AAC.1